MDICLIFTGKLEYRQRNGMIFLLFGWPDPDVEGKKCKQIGEGFLATGGWVCPEAIDVSIVVKKRKEKSEARLSCPEKVVKWRNLRDAYPASPSFLEHSGVSAHNKCRCMCTEQKFNFCAATTQKKRGRNQRICMARNFLRFTRARYKDKNRAAIRFGCLQLVVKWKDKWSLHVYLIPRRFQVLALFWMVMLVLQEMTGKRYICKDVWIALAGWIPRLIPRRSILSTQEARVRGHKFFCRWSIEWCICDWRHALLHLTGPVKGRRKDWIGIVAPSSTIPLHSPLFRFFFFLFPFCLYLQFRRPKLHFGQFFESWRVRIDLCHITSFFTYLLLDI